MLSCLRQRLLPPKLLPKVEQRFRDLAAQGKVTNDSERELTNLRAELAQAQAQLKTVSGNMALAKTPEQFEAISATFDQFSARVNLLKTQIVEAESKTAQVPDTEAEIAGAMDVIHRLTELVADTSGLGHATEAFRLTNARLFMRFRPVQSGKRILNKVAGGVVVLGIAPDPIEIYRGPTGRRALNYNGSTALVAAEPGKLDLPTPPEATIGSGLEGKSLRNVSRGDWI
jgi:multidrug efflux pump subunit AcrA (membrane-fusion protein)